MKLSPFLTTLIGVCSLLALPLASTDTTIAGEAASARQQLEEIEKAVQRLRKLLQDIESRVATSDAQSNATSGKDSVIADPEAIVGIPAGTSHPQPIRTHPPERVVSSSSQSADTAPQLIYHVHELDQEERPTLEWLAQATPCCVRPVNGGVWIQLETSLGRDRTWGAQQAVAFIDEEREGIRLLMIGHFRDWDALGNRALAITADRTALFVATANPPSLTRYEERPEGYRWLDSVDAHGKGFLLSSPYKPLWLLEPETGDSQELSLARVRDKDFDRLGGGDYYQPIVRRLVRAKRGELWGLQGTLDADRGNAFFRYAPDSGASTHYLDPWSQDPAGRHWPVGVTDRGLWLQDGKSIFLLNPATGTLQPLTCGWPGGVPHRLHFKDGSAYVVGETSIYRLAHEGCNWQQVLSIHGAASIGGIQLQGNRWTFGTPGALAQIQMNELEEPQNLTIWPLRLTEDAVVYELVQGPAAAPTRSEDPPVLGNETRGNKGTAAGQGHDPSPPPALMQALDSMPAAPVCVVSEKNSVPTVGVTGLVGSGAGQRSNTAARAEPTEDSRPVDNRVAQGRSGLMPAQEWPSPLQLRLEIPLHLHSLLRVGMPLSGIVHPNADIALRHRVTLQVGALQPPAGPAAETAAVLFDIPNDGSTKPGDTLTVLVPDPEGLRENAAMVVRSAVHRSGDAATVMVIINDAEPIPREVQLLDAIAEYFVVSGVTPGHRVLCHHPDAE